MKSTHRVFGRLIPVFSFAVLFATTLASSLKADEIIETDSFVAPQIINFNSWDADLSVPQFDPSLGILNKVTIELMGCSDSLIGFGKGTAGNVAVSGEVGAEITLSLPGGGELVAMPAGDFSGVVPGPGSPTFSDLLGTDLVSTMTTNLCAFIGTGAVTFPTHAETISNVFFGPGAGGTFWGWEVDSSVVLVVTYEFSIPGDNTETDFFVAPQIINFNSWDTDLNVPQFDPSLGVLNNVTIEMLGCSDSLIGFGKSIAGNVTVSGEVGAEITLSLPGGGELVAMPAGNFNGVVPGPGSATFSDLLGTDLVSTNATVLSAFVGTGTVVFPTHAETISNVVFGPGAGGTFWGWEVDSMVRLVVTYEYSTPTEALEDLQELITIDLDASDFSHANRQKTMGKKVNAVIDKIDAGDLTSIVEAIDKLTNDILPKTDGESPPPDWVVDPQAQQALEERINAIIDALLAEL